MMQNLKGSKLFSMKNSLGTTPISCETDMLNLKTEPPCNFTTTRASCKLLQDSDKPSSLRPQKKKSPNAWWSHESVKRIVVTSVLDLEEQLIRSCHVVGHSLLHIVSSVLMMLDGCLGMGPIDTWYMDPSIDFPLVFLIYVCNNL